MSYSNAKTFGDVHIAGGAIDLTSGAMIVTTSSFGFVPAGGTARRIRHALAVAEYGDAAIHDALAEGFNVNNGWWNGSNGITSSTAATDPTTSTTVGWIDNQLGFYSTFKTDGQGNPVPVGPGQSIIGYTYFGDADLNGFVDTGDYGLWSAGLGQPVGLNGQNGQMITSYYVPGHEGTPQSILEPVEWPDADLDQSGAVDTGDYGLWSATLGLPALYTPAASRTRDCRWSGVGARAVNPVSFGRGWLVRARRPFCSKASCLVADQAAWFYFILPLTDLQKTRRRKRISTMLRTRLTMLAVAVSLAVVATAARAELL